MGQYETSGQWNHLYLHKWSMGQIINKVCYTNLVGQYETSGQWNH